jgi:hypothetical protein
LARNQYIKKTCALFLLVLMALATTPKLLLHNILANHKDVSFQVNKDGHAKVHTGGINCHAQDLVVEVPFVQVSVPKIEKPVIFSVQVFGESINSLLSLTDFYFQLRGPPAIA